MTDIARYIMAFVCIFTVVQLSSADTIRLRRAASVEGDRVRLADVADIEGDRAAAFGDIVVGTFGNKTEVRIQMNDLHTMLEGRGVNWGLLSLAGQGTCRVQRVVAEAPTPVNQSLPVAAANPTVTNPGQPIDLTTAVTLRQRISQYIRENAGVPADELVLTFNETDAKMLDLPVLGQKCEFEPISVSLIGRVPMTVRLWKDGRAPEQHRVTVDVARRMLAVVASSSLPRGETVRRGQVEMREVTLRDGRTRPLTSIDDVIGKSVAGIVKQDAIVTSEDLRSPVLVQRGEFMQVRCVSGGIVIRLKARAAQNGEMGQTISVRPEGQREDLSVRVTGPGEGMSVIGSAPSAVPSLSGFDPATGRTAMP